MTREQFTDEIHAGASIMGVDLNDLALDRLYLYYKELGRWNPRVNLVSRQQHDWLKIHFLDSLAALSLGLIGNVFSRPRHAHPP